LPRIGTFSAATRLPVAQPLQGNSIIFNLPGASAGMVDCGTRPSLVMNNCGGTVPVALL